MTTIDDGARARFLQRAMEAGITDYGVIPLYFEVAAWASRKGFAYTARGDEYTLAQGVTRAP